MINIAQLKQNLDFNRDLGELIEIMRLASTSQFNQFRSYRPAWPEFSASLEKALALIPPDQRGSDFFVLRPGKPSAIILLTSDEGFLGELNSALINRLFGEKKEGDRIIVLGQQGINYLKELNLDFQEFSAFSDKPELKQIEDVRDYALGLYLKGEVSRIAVVYASFQSLTAQHAESETLLPFQVGKAPAKNIKGELLIEPGSKEVIEGLVRLWLYAKLYQIFWAGKLSEFGARIMHLESSSQELTRTNQGLRLEYFKYLHGLSDKTIREIYASRLAVRK